MKVLEFEAKALLKSAGFVVPPSELITMPDAAASAAQAVGLPVVIKSQVPTGGRMKAGGIRFANTPEETKEAARRLFGAQIRGFTVERLLIEKKLDIAAELFLAATYDAAARSAVLLASAAGGIEIESSVQLVRKPFSSLSPISDYIGREIAVELGFTGSQLSQLAALITQVAQCFSCWDALLLEINPVVLDTSGKWWVADAHLELDDDAAYRQQELLSHLPYSVEIANRRSAFEQRALEIDSADHRGVAGRLVTLDGDLGLLIGGGGASLTVLDAVLDAGLRPANYCEIGGNPSVWKIKELTKLILSQPQVKRLAVVMNVVSNSRVDLMARGVIKGILELGLDPTEVISVFRIPGSWEEEGQAILDHYGVKHFGRDTSIDQVIAAIQ
jgi:succinyl-CoA synthetase beta subunit/citryl-CoA synthetase large subunit